MAKPQSSQLTLIRILRSSSIKQRAKKRHTQRKILLAIFAITTLLLLVSLVFGVWSIADAIASRVSDPNENNDSLTPNPLPQVVIYEKIPYSNTAVHVGELLLVNMDHAYDFDANKDLSASLKNISNNRVMYNDVSNTFQVNEKTWKLHEKALEALNSMMYKHYEIYADGATLVSSAYRTFEDQAALVSSTVDPGFSDHHTGYCVALKKNDKQQYLEETSWIYDQCYKYGFVQRYPDEKSSITGISNYEHCLRYVGVAHATYMTQNNLCMEEYISRLQTDFSGETHLAITGADGKQYEVYYVAKSTEGELTTLPLPKNFAYTVSGDNVGGFIVTVDLSSPIV